MIHLLLLFSSFLNHGLCAHSSLPENSSIFPHDEVIIRVGVVLDMESWTGKSIRSFMNFAISDFYARNSNYRTRIVLHTRDSKGEPLEALLAVNDLLNNIKVQAIIGAETYLEAKLLAPIVDKAKVPIFSLAGSPNLEYPFLFQIKEDESIMSKSIIVLMDSFGWREVIFLYENIDYGREILSYFLESFQDKSFRINHVGAISFLSTDEQITQVLQKIKISHTTVIIVHMPSLLASRVLLIAKRMGMVNEEYAWIVTYNNIDILQPLDNEVMETYQGVIGVRPYIPASGKLLNLTMRWYNECYNKNPSFVSREVSVLTIWAYDTIWALAESVQKLGIQYSSDFTQMNLMLQHELSKTRFKGISGEFQLIDGKLVSNGFKIVNVIENKERRSSTTKKRQMLQMIGSKKLKVGVLTDRKFTNFIDLHHDIQENITTATGFSVDVFNACIKELPFEVLYELIPYDNVTYDDLIKKVYLQEIDAILGDSTILANRSKFVDFTAAYTEIGSGTLARIKHNDMWIFLKPLDVDLWLITIAFAFLTGFVVWAIESMDQESQKTSTQQIGSAFWFILMTLFFAQREKLSSNLSKFVVFVWLLVVLILISSYTATLTSLLTVEQFEFASKGGTVGFHGGSFEAGLEGVTVSNVHFEDYRRSPFYSYDDYAKALAKGGKHGGADAIIDEIPYIKMFLAKYSTDYAMIGSEPSSSGFAFIFQKGSPLVPEMSRQIAKMREDITLRQLEDMWFKKHSLSSLDPQRKPQSLSFDRFRGLFIISGCSSAFALVISVSYLLLQKLEVHEIISFIMRRDLVAALRYLLRGNAISV